MSAAGAGGGAAAPNEHALLGGSVTLKAADGTAFVVERRVAMVSGFLRTLLSSSIPSGGAVDFPDISAPTLARVVEYMKFKTAHAGSRGPLPHFEVPPEAALELLVASNYLDV